MRNIVSIIFFIGVLLSISCQDMASDNDAGEDADVDGSVDAGEDAGADASIDYSDECTALQEAFLLCYSEEYQGDCLDNPPLCFFNCLPLETCADFDACWKACL